jgi:phage protein U
MKEYPKTANLKAKLDTLKELANKNKKYWLISRNGRVHGEHEERDEKENHQPGHLHCGQLPP